MKTDRIFPDYDLKLMYTGDKVEIELVTNVRCLEQKNQIWYKTQVAETTRCDHDKVTEALNDAMRRFLKQCYLQMTLGIPSYDITNRLGESLFKADTNQQTEKERMKNLHKKELGIE